MIRYAAVIGESIVDGVGVRVTAFFQGCPRQCAGCHNPDLQPLAGGREITVEDFAGLILAKITPWHRGVTFSGGDPLLQAAELARVITVIRARRPDLDIWVYTGYLFEAVQDLPVIGLIDVLVDGPFIREQRDLSLAFRGSANQRLIDVPRSLAAGRVITLAGF
ncbi:MAG: anaerobic ribonucleoside-triphosphate reductase activating protein [Heliobacteriaceae bacterium]|nr:anaerobic ribonucleoside-triphosphate reductase activating protein [Heliobacteriaceae bacterium]